MNYSFSHKHIVKLYQALASTVFVSLTSRIRSSSNLENYHHSFIISYNFEVMFDNNASDQAVMIKGFKGSMSL
jgi:hypothetical protein